MAAPEITAAGLSIQTFDDAFTQLCADVRNALGQQMRASDPNSVIGIVDGFVARASALVQGAVQGTYLARTLDGANGTDLDRLFQLAGLYRKVATQSRVTLHMANGSGAIVTIPGSALVQIANTTYQFVMGATFGVGASGSADISVLAVATGPTPVDAGQSWQWVSSFTGSTAITITNPDSGVQGVDVEDDAAFKFRFVQSLATAGAGTLASIRTAILAIVAVQEVAAFENDGDGVGITSPVTIGGIPAHSFTVAVKGTEDPQNVGNAIFAKKPAGIATFGATSVTVTDDQNYTHTINFQEASALEVYVTAHVYGPAGLTASASAIQAAILRYVNGAAASGTTPETLGLRVAQTMLFNRVYASISDVCDSSGFDATNIVLTMGTAPSPSGTANVVPDWDKYCHLTGGHCIVAVN